MTAITPETPVSGPRIRRGPVAGGPAAAAVAVVALVLVLAVVGPAVIGQDPLAQNLLHLNRAPDAQHWLGTDNLGRDVAARLAEGARLTLAVGAGGLLLALALGAGASLLALAAGGPLPLLVFGAVDLVRTMPGILLALLLIVALGPSAGSVTVALGIAFAPVFAYVARAVWHREMAADYVAAATVFGASRLRILWRHVLPNIAGALVTQAAIVLPRCIVTESVLSFLGLGVSPEAATWGRMISDASRFVERAPHAVLAPVILLALLTLALSVLGDRLRRHLDPLRRGAPGGGS
ncbi:ABC transporter permease [Azospirillum halopraeferens]|uniref:ABC transporter permease n=1 Tax=Azospirillum halopraeferens TaxID=34010 RepID=UPI0003FD8FE8|nr:ABC transporter permease [Azospirillum halopraeferens]